MFNQPKSFAMGEHAVYVHRVLESGWHRINRQFPVLLLTGPRQVGKTTVLQHVCEHERDYVSLDDPNSRHLARRDPGLFLQQHPPPVLIDEVQYAPELFPLIKISVDRNRTNGAFWLTGSQQFHMMQRITESLAGRVAVIRLLGFSSRETASQPEPDRPFMPDREAYSPASPVRGVREIYERI